MLGQSPPDGQHNGQDDSQHDGPRDRMAIP